MASSSCSSSPDRAAAAAAPNITGSRSHYPPSVQYEYSTNTDDGDDDSCCVDVFSAITASSPSGVSTLTSGNNVATSMSRSSVSASASASASMADSVSLTTRSSTGYHSSYNRQYNEQQYYHHHHHHRQDSQQHLLYTSNLYRAPSFLFAANNGGSSRSTASVGGSISAASRGTSSRSLMTDISTAVAPGSIGTTSTHEQFHHAPSRYPPYPRENHHLLHQDSFYGASSSSLSVAVSIRSFASSITAANATTDDIGVGGSITSVNSNRSTSHYQHNILQDRNHQNNPYIKDNTLGDTFYQNITYSRPFSHQETHIDTPTTTTATAEADANACAILADTTAMQVPVPPVVRRLSFDGSRTNDVVGLGRRRRSSLSTGEDTKALVATRATKPGVVAYNNICDSSEKPGQHVGDEFVNQRQVLQHHPHNANEQQIIHNDTTKQPMMDGSSSSNINHELDGSSDTHFCDEGRETFNTIGKTLTDNKKYSRNIHRRASVPGANFVYSKNHNLNGNSNSNSNSNSNQEQDGILYTRKTVLPGRFGMSSSKRRLSTSSTSDGTTKSDGLMSAGTSQSKYDPGSSKTTSRAWSGTRSLGVDIKSINTTMIHSTADANSDATTMAVRAAESLRAVDANIEQRRRKGHNDCRYYSPQPGSAIAEAASFSNNDPYAAKAKRAQARSLASLQRLDHNISQRRRSSLSSKASPPERAVTTTKYSAGPTATLSTVPLVATTATATFDPSTSETHQHRNYDLLLSAKQARTLNEHFDGPMSAERLRRDNDSSYRHVRLLNPPMSPSRSITTTHNDSQRSMSVTADEERGDGANVNQHQPSDGTGEGQQPTNASMESTGSVMVAQVSRAPLRVLPEQETDGPDNDNHQNYRHKRPCCLTHIGMLVVVVIVVTTVATAIGIVVSQPNQTTDATASASNSPFDGTDTNMAAAMMQPATLEEFYNSLPAKTQAILQEQDPDYPQYKAWEWIRNMDELFQTYPLWRQQQRFALATVYFAFYNRNSDEEQDLLWFQPDTDECQWAWNPSDSEDKACDDETGRYTKLSLRFDNGETAPDDAEKKASLTVTSSRDGRSNSSQFASSLLIDGTLSSSSISNATSTNTSRHRDALQMPAEIGMLSFLEQLVLSHMPSESRLHQLWPPEVLGLPQLQELEITSSPQMAGTIPSEIGLSSTLRYLYLEGTSISGTIPTELGNASQLKELNLGDNAHLGGSLPSQLGLLSNLTLVWVHDNPLLGGGLPTEYGMLDKLVFLSLRANALTGSIPSELGSMTQLQELQLGLNNLSGTVPSELGALTYLRTLELSENEALTGRIPQGLCSLQPDQVKYDVDCEKIMCCFDVQGIDSNGDSRDPTFN